MSLIKEMPVLAGLPAARDLRQAPLAHRAPLALDAGTWGLSEVKVTGLDETAASAMSPCSSICSVLRSR